MKDQCLMGPSHVVIPLEEKHWTQRTRDRQHRRHNTEKGLGVFPGSRDNFGPNLTNNTHTEKFLGK